MLNVEITGISLSKYSKFVMILNNADLILVLHIFTKYAVARLGHTCDGVLSVKPVSLRGGTETQGSTYSR